MGFDLTLSAEGGAALAHLHTKITELSAVDAPSGPGPRVVRAENDLSVLHELRDQGMMLVRSLVRQTTPVMDDLQWPAPRIEFAYDFDAVGGYTQLARSLSQTIQLRLRLENEITGLLVENVPSRPLPEFPPPPVGHLPQPEKDLAAFRETVRMNVLEAIKPGYEEDRDEDQAEQLRGRLQENLADGRRFDAYLSLNLYDAIRAICKDLDFTPDWNRWNGETWKPPRGPPAPLSPGDQFIEDQLVSAGIPPKKLPYTYEG
jgi:hypothetical protein